MTAYTATGYRAVRSDSLLASERRRRGGWGAPGRWFEEGELTGQRQPSRARGIQELGVRSASAPKVRMRRESKTGNCACECQIE
eukprot:4104890-Pleurochrysis_carterae.AAC.1